jgi:hypothetical protein
MKAKPHRDHNAQAAMLGYRTGLAAATCKAWIEAPIAKSLEAIYAAFTPDSDDNSIIVTRSEIKAFALARVKEQSRGSTWRGIGGRYLN